MSINVKVQQAALTLLNQFHNKQNYSLEDRQMPTDLDEAYQIQREFQSHVSEEQGAIAGYKLAYTTTSLQESVGVSDPVLGLMLEDNIRHATADIGDDVWEAFGVFLRDLQPVPATGGEVL